MKFEYQKLILGPRDPNSPLVPRPFIPVYLIANSKKTASPYFALLDSGADSVLFPTDLAEDVGIENIEDGRLEEAMGIGGEVARVFYHEVQMQILGDSSLLRVEVGFAHDLLIPILGRSFFRHFRAVVFSEVKEQVELRN